MSFRAKGGGSPDSSASAGALTGSPVDKPFRGGQSYRDCAEEMRDFLEDIIREFDGRRVLVSAHSAQRYALRQLLEGIPFEDLVDAPFEWQ